MKSFLDYLSEDVVPAALVTNGTISLDNEETRASVNMALAKVTADSSITPYIALNRIAKALSYFSIILPKRIYLEGSKGVEVHEIRQFGEKMGMNDQGEFIREVPGKFYLFVQYGMNSPMNHGSQLAYPTMGGTFRVTAKVVDKVELDKLVSMAELALAEECDAEMQQRKSKMLAPHDEMHDVTSDEKKKGNKQAVADSQKGLKEAKTVKVKLNPEKEVGHTVHDVGRGGKKTLVQSGKMKVKDIKEEGIGDTIRGAIAKATGLDKLDKALSVPGAQAAPKQDMRIMGNPDTAKKPAPTTPTTPVKEENIDEGRKSSRNPLSSISAKRMANAPRDHAKDDEFRKKYPTAHLPMTPKRAEEMKARRIAADKASAERRAKEDTVKEGVGEPITGSRRHSGSADRKRKAVQMALGRKHKDEEGWNDRINPQTAALRHGRALQKKGVTKEETINEISHKLALKAMKKSEKRSDDEYEADQAYDRLSDYKTHEDRAKRLRGHMRRKFGNNKPGRGTRSYSDDRLGDGGGDGRLGVYAVNTHGKRAGLPPKQQVNRLKNNIRYSLGKHHKPNLPEETQLDELSRGTVARYKKAAESDKKSAEVSADVSRAGRKNRANPLKTRIEHGKEEKWLKGIAKKREKGIAMADKRLEEKLTKGMSAGDVIHDFVHSDDPKFKGKSVKERQKMALGAYYGMHPEKSKK